jgi:hypothetical protein
MECQCNDQNFLAKGTKDNHKRKEEVDILIYYHALTFILLQSSISIRQQTREMAVSLGKQGPISLLPLLILSIG